MSRCVVPDHGPLRGPFPKLREKQVVEAILPFLAVSFSLLLWFLSFPLPSPRLIQVLSRSFMKPSSDFAPPPPPPPAPAPYVLTGLEDADLDDYLTSESLQKVALTKAVVAEKEKNLDNLSDLELAVKRRAAKKVDASLVEQAKVAAKRVDDIRFEKTLAAQSQVSGWFFLSGRTLNKRSWRRWFRKRNESSRPWTNREDRI